MVSISKGLQTAPCLQPGDPGLNVMLSIIKRRLLKSCCAACVVARRDSSFFPTFWALPN